MKADTRMHPDEQQQDGLIDADIQSLDVGVINPEHLVGKARIGDVTEQEYRDGEAERQTNGFP